VTENVVKTRPTWPRGGYAPLIMLALAVGASASVVALLLLRSGGTKHALPAPNSGPALVSQAQLERLAASTQEPVYWAGPQEGYSYELTRTTGGRTYIRYLRGGARAGDPRPSFLVVGTYAQTGSFAYLKHAAKTKGSVSVGIDRGGIAVFSSAKPTSVFFTYPGAKYQVEVYDPSGDTARKLVLSGRITPIK
jgi:hypothetical protein